MYLGSWLVGDTLAFFMQTTSSEGRLTEADGGGEPLARIYEDQTETIIVGAIGMTLFDEGNTQFAFYKGFVDLIAASGFERGKNYIIYIDAIVNGNPIGEMHSFQIGADAARTTVTGTVDTTAFTATTTQFEADDITEATLDHYKDRVVIWTGGPTGNTKDQAKDITAYSLVGGRGRFTVSTMVEAPADNDTFIIV